MMTSSVRLRKRLRLAAALLFVVLLSSACTSLNRVNFEVIASQEVDEAGATISVVRQDGLDAGRTVSLVVPANALTGTTTIEIGVVTDALEPPLGIDIVSDIYYFGPKCLRPEASVTAILPYRSEVLTGGRSIGDLRLLKFEKGAWSELASRIDQNNETIEGELDRMCILAVGLLQGGTAPRSPVITEFRASPPEIVRGNSSTLSWSVNGPADLSITISPGIGAVAASGSREVSPGDTTTYTLSASNADFLVSQSLDVAVRDPAGEIGNVVPNPLLLPDVAFGETSTGSFSFDNIGGTPLDFTVTTGASWLTVLDPARAGEVTGTLAPGATQSIDVEGVCSEAGTREATVVIAGAGTASATLEVRLICGAPPAPRIGAPTPNPLEFAPALVGDPAQTQSVSFDNTGTAPLAFVIEEEAAWLEPTPPSGDLAPGATQTLDLAATCTQAGELSATVIIREVNDAVTSQTFRVVLPCSEPPAISELFTSPTPLAFETFVGNSLDGSVGFTNVGGAELTFDITETPDDAPWLELTPPTSGSLAPSQSQVSEFAVTCLAIGEFSATLSVASNDPFTPTRTAPVTLTCTEPPDISDPDPASLDFTVMAGESDQGSFSFENVGGSALTFSLQEAAPWLNILSATDGVLEPGSSTVVDLEVICPALTQPRDFSTTLSVVSNDPDEAVKNVAITLACTLPPGMLQLTLSGLPDGSSTTVDILGGPRDSAQTVVFDNFAGGAQTQMLDLAPGVYDLGPERGVSVGGVIYDPRQTGVQVSIISEQVTSVTIEYAPREAATP